MEKNKIIIIALIAAIAVLAACITYALILHPSVEYETIQISNGTTIEVPKADDASWKKDSTGIKMYSCPSKNTVMNTFNSQEDMNLVGAGAFALSRDILMEGASDVEKYNNYQIKENTLNGTHYYIVYISSAATHDNIIIGSDNLDILKHMIDSLKLGAPGEGQINATLESGSGTSSSSNTNNSDNKYSEDDLMLAAKYGYYSGYSDGYDDSYQYYDYDDYSDSDVETTTDDSSYDYDDYEDYGNVETTTEG